MIDFTWSLQHSSAFDEDFNRLRSYIGWKELNGATFLLTGATGFFGLWLIELFDWIHRKEALDFSLYVLSRDRERVLSQHPVYRGRPWLNIFEGDIRNFVPPVQKFDYILHGATDTTAEAGRKSLDIFDVIYSGTRRVLDLAQSSGCKRVLLISSGAVYGSALGAEKVPETQLTAPNLSFPSCAYGEGKRICEALGTFAAHSSSLEVISARCFSFVGAGLPLDAHFAIGNFIQDSIERKDIILKSTGQSMRSYLYAADLAIWLINLLLKGKSGKSYNVGSDRELNILEAAYYVRDVLAPDLSINITPGASVNANYYVPNIELARNELGLDVWTDLDFAIRRTAEDAQQIGPYRRIHD